MISWQSRTALRRGREDIGVHFSVTCRDKDKEIGLIPISLAKDHWIRSLLAPPKYPSWNITTKYLSWN